MSPKKPAKPYHHGNLRRELLDCAARLLDEGGAVGLSLRDVARQAGVSQAAPFRHFPSKEALLVALAEEGFEELEARFSAAKVAGGSPWVQLEELATGYLELAARRPHFFKMMFSADLGPSRVAEGIYRACDRVYRDLVQAFVDAQAGGELGPGSPEQQALTYWSTLHGYAMLLVDHRLDDLGLEFPGQRAVLLGILDVIRRGLAPTPVD